MLTKDHPSATKKDVDNFLLETYSMTNDELIIFYKKCTLDGGNNIDIKKTASALSITTKAEEMCKNIKQMALKHPDATASDISKYLEYEYDMKSNEMKLFHKECFVEEKVKNIRKAETAKEHKQQSQKPVQNVDPIYGRREWLKRSQEC